jgi:hypothetical protein
MGKSKSNTTSTSSTTPTFINTNTSNPYYTTTTDKNGNTTNKFVKGSAGETAYNFVNQNISGLLDDYLRPNLNSATNQAKLAAFNKQQQTNLQNNIINPLANNNMVRSSQATNMYNNLSNQAADYTNNLLANSQNDTWNMINNLMNLYTTGYTGANNDIATAFKAAVGNSSTSSSNSKA